MFADMAAIRTELENNQQIVFQFAASPRNTVLPGGFVKVHSQYARRTAGFACRFKTHYGFEVY